MNNVSDNKVGKEGFVTIDTRESNQSCLEAWFLHFCWPFLCCRCALGYQHCSEGLQTDEGLCFMGSSCSAEQWGRCKAFWCFATGFKTMLDITKTAWKRWPALPICLLISCIFFIGFLAFNRVPMQADNEDLIRSINSTMIWTGILAITISTVMMCGFYFILHEFTSTYSHTIPEEPTINITPLENQKHNNNNNNNHHHNNNDDVVDLFGDDNDTF